MAFPFSPMSRCSPCLRASVVGFWFSDHPIPISVISVNQW